MSLKPVNIAAKPQKVDGLNRFDLKVAFEPFEARFL